MAHVQTINRKTGQCRVRISVPKVAGLAPKWVVSGTLERLYKVECCDTHVLGGGRQPRVMHAKQNGHNVLVLAQPTAVQLAMGCDGCGTTHSASNVRCMANTPESLVHAVPGYLYGADRRRGNKFEYTVVHHHKTRTVVTLQSVL